MSKDHYEFTARFSKETVNNISVMANKHGMNVDKMIDELAESVKQNVIHELNSVVKCACGKPKSLDDMYDGMCRYYDDGKC